MNNDNTLISIETVSSSALAAGAITLASVKASLDAFRASKKNQGTPIPKTIWDAVRILLKSHNEAEVMSYLSITRVQLNREKNAPSAAKDSEQKTISKEAGISFCEAQQEAAYPLAFKPAKAFATNTSIVELQRADGIVMKIHICTDRFEELLSAFFKGSCND